MSNIVSIAEAARRRAAQARNERKSEATGKTLCRRGFHKWRIDQRKQFDVKAGRLVTVRECERCGVRRTSLD
jgi:hypothetical protein